MKRGRDELEAGDDGEAQPEQAVAQEPAAAAGAPEEEDDDDKPLLSNYKMSRSVRKGAECPYLDTISRQVPPPARRLPAAAARLLHVCWQPVTAL